MREDLVALHAAALVAADPGAAVAGALRFDGHEVFVGDRAIALGREAHVWMIAIGKASRGMARAAIDVLEGRIAGGMVVHPHAIDPGGSWPPTVRMIAAGHPLPDGGSIRAGEAALDLLRRVRPSDVVVVLLSGGGSALIEALQTGVTLEELRGVTEALQHEGADIVELNTVRRAMSRIKGGGVARAAGPACVITLLLSDVLGDRLEAIASGPTVESPTGPEEALAVLARHGLAERFSGLVDAIRHAASAGEPAGRAGERVECVVGSNRIAAAALCAGAEARGFRALLLTDRMQGEAREIGRCLGGIARGMRERGLPLPPPSCLVLGGETTVTVRGHGHGGRNLELALGAALVLEGCPRAAVFSFGTDGVDGSSSAAGAVATGDTIARAKAIGLSAHRALADNDSEPFFAALGDLWATGPSGTNVNDLALALAYP